MATSFISLVKSFARDERGASMAEYAILLGLITTALIGLVTAFGAQLGAQFSAVTGILATATPQ